MRLTLAHGLTRKGPLAPRPTPRQAHRRSAARAGPPCRVLGTYGNLGRHRWVIERTLSWLGDCRRMHRRYERKAEHLLAVVGIARAFIHYRRLPSAWN
ncbi:transposase [Streptomyces sp. NBC_01589]|uniref:transposase n=1 Tax=Streptomyces sp. NBC_01589 TaxID=2975886 RepID=UPI003868F366